MLWDIIRDFLVQHLTGGITSNDTLYDFNVGGGLAESDILFTINGGTDNAVYLSIGDYLATTLTIIVMCLIFVFAIWLVRWLFKAVSSAFLLRR